MPYRLTDVVSNVLATVTAVFRTMTRLAVTVEVAVVVVVATAVVFATMLPARVADEVRAAVPNMVSNVGTYVITAASYCGDS